MEIVAQKTAGHCSKGIPATLRLWEADKPHSTVGKGYGSPTEVTELSSTSSTRRNIRGPKKTILENLTLNFPSSQLSALIPASSCQSLSEFRHTLLRKTLYAEGVWQTQVICFLCSFLFSSFNCLPSMSSSTCCSVYSLLFLPFLQRMSTDLFRFGCVYRVTTAGSLGMSQKCDNQAINQTLTQPNTHSIE